MTDKRPNAATTTLPFAALVASIERSVDQLRDGDLSRRDRRSLIAERGRSDAAVWQPIGTAARLAGRR